MRRLSGGTVMILMATLVSYLMAFLINKVIAEQLGLEGVAVAGAVASTAAIAASVALLGQVNAIPVWAANHPGLPPRHTMSLAVRAALWMLPVALIPTLLIGVPLLAAYGSTAVLAGGIALAALGQLWSLLAWSLLSTYRDPSALLTLAALSGLTSALVTCAGVLALGYAWLPTSIGVGMLAGPAIATLAFLRGSGVRTERTTPAQLRAFIRTGIESFPGILINAVVIGGLPLLVLTLTDETAAGLFRSAWTLSTVLLAAALALLKNVYYPEAARVVARDEDPSALHRGIVSRSILIISVGSIGLCVLAPLLLRVLYAPEFVPASSSVAALTILSTARTGLYLNQFWLNANGRGRDYSLLEGGFLILLLVSIVGASMLGTSLAISVACAGAGLIALAGSEVLLLRRRIVRPLGSTRWWGLLLVVIQLLLATAICVVGA